MSQSFKTSIEGLSVLSAAFRSVSTELSVKQILCTILSLGMCAPCNLTEAYWYFGGTCCLSRHSSSFFILIVVRTPNLTKLSTVRVRDNCVWFIFDYLLIGMNLFVPFFCTLNYTDSVTTPFYSLLTYPMHICKLCHVFSRIYIGSIFGMKQLSGGFEFVQLLYTVSECSLFF
jgi:hypothetical protein